MSIILANLYAADKDDGDTFWYSSTAQKNTDKSDDATTGTKMLDKAMDLGTPIRVLRSGNGSVKKGEPPNPYRPRVDIRYDGLYKITDHEVHDAQQHVFKYQFVREPHQSPIRYQGETVRPSKEEIEAWSSVQADVKIWD